jgi:hypothetical protein
MTKRRLIVVLAVMAMVMAVMAPAAFGTPPEEVFEAKGGWTCEGDGFVGNHCLNTKSNGKTLNIKVFPPDPRGPQESASTDPKANSRPCPHDSGSDDGTWWVFTNDFGGETLYVCHHSGSQP